MIGAMSGPIYALNLFDIADRRDHLLEFIGFETGLVVWPGKIAIEGEVLLNHRCSEPNGCGGHGVSWPSR